MRKHSILLVCILFCSLFAFAASDLQRVIEGLPERGDGAFLRNYPNGFRIFGVGTAAIEDADDPNSILRAEKVSAMEAKKQISNYISQTLSAEETAKTEFQKAEKVDEVEGTETTTSTTNSFESFSSEMKSGTQNLMRGVVTLKVIQVQKGKFTYVKTLVGYSSKTLNALEQANSGANGTNAAPEVEAPQSTAGGSATEAPEEKAEEWLLCVGRGATRDLAVKAAVLEGIQQIYGAYMESSETYKTRFAKLSASGSFSDNEGTSGESVNAKMSSTEQTQEILSQSKGFVEAYRIVSVTEVASGLEATIKAKFTNPRAGGLKAIMVYPMAMPISKQTNVYTIAPKKKVSGKELGQICERRLERAFSKANKYLVLNLDDMLEVVNQHNLTKELVNADLASPAELSKAGKMLTADYILNTSFGDYSYTRKMGMNKATKKLENIERVVFTFDYSIIEVKTGERRKQNTVNVVLDNQAIAAVRAEDDQCTEDELATKIFEQTMSAAVALLAEEAKF